MIQDRRNKAANNNATKRNGLAQTLLGRANGKGGARNNFRTSAALPNAASNAVALAANVPTANNGRSNRSNSL